MFCHGSKWKEFTSYSRTTMAFLSILIVLRVSSSTTEILHRKEKSFSLLGSKSQKHLVLLVVSATTLIRRLGLLNEKDLFGDAVKEWSYYSPLDKTFKTVLGPPYIKAICVDDEYFRCNSGKVYLNDTVTGNQAEILNDPRTDFFAKVPNVYESIRSVFKHSRQEWYLYYRDGYWRVGTSYTGSGTDLLRTKDLAHRPEYVTNYWESWTTKGWTAGSGLRMKCRGIANGENECYDKPCNGQGTCVYTADNETVCLCQDSTHGPNCENKDACSDPGIPANSIEVVHAGNRPGDISTSFCATGYRSSPVEFFVCEQDHGRKNCCSGCLSQRPLVKSHRL